MRQARQPGLDRYSAESDPDRNHKHGDRKGAANALDDAVHGEDHALLDELVRCLIFSSNFIGSADMLVVCQPLQWLELQNDVS